MTSLEEGAVYSFANKLLKQTDVLENINFIKCYKHLLQDASFKNNDHFTNDKMGFSCNFI